MPTNPKPGYPNANTRDANDKPVNTASPDGGQSAARHPASVQSGTRQTQHSTDYAENTA